MRYVYPRKLKTKRGLLKATLNAWCMSCQQPMARHGKNFTCSDCHVATRIRIENGLGRRCGVIRQGKSRSQGQQSSYPFCLKCKIRMHRFSRASTQQEHAFRCRQCRAITSSHVERGQIYEREARIIKLLEAGHLDSQIVRKMKCHHTTVRRLRKEVKDVRLCECGQLYHHVSKCHLRAGWQTLVKERRTLFDDLLVRVNRRVPSAFPDEMRDEICQEMFLEVIKSIDRVLGNAPEFIRRYKKRYPFQYHSFDANPDLVERIAG